MDVAVETEILPAEAPADLGENTTLNVVLWPGSREMGRVFIPLSWKPDPVTEICEIVIPVEPVLLTVSVLLCC